MISIYADGEPLHIPGDEESACHDVDLSLEANSAASLKFTIPPTNPMYSEIAEYDPTREIVVYDDDREIMRGRVVDAQDSDYAEKPVEVEGDLAYLNDTLVRPFVCTATDDTPEGTAVVGVRARAVVEYLLSQHNEHCSVGEHIELGTMDFSAALDCDVDDYPTVGECMKEQVLEELGVYARTRMDGGVRRLDLLSTGGPRNAQRIEFGVNLLSYARETDMSQVSTAIVPVFTIDGEDMLLPDVLADGTYFGMMVQGTRMVNVAAAAEFGIHEVKKEYTSSSIDAAITSLVNDCTSLAESFDTVTIGAVDLHIIDPTVQPISLYDWVEIVAEPIGIDKYMICSAVSMTDDPADTVYTFGTVLPTLTKSAVQGLRAYDSAANGIRMAAALSEAQKAMAERLADLSGTYVHIRYSESVDGADMTEEPGEDTLYIGICSDESEDAPEDASAYAWTRIKGDQGIQGKAGADGQASYLHIKYSDDAGETFTDDDGETVGAWMGTCVTTEKADPDSVSDYKWVRIKGEQGAQGIQGIQGPQGEQGIQGATGATGAASYFHIKYSPVASPTASQMTEEPDVYIGTYVDTTSADSDNPSDYSWSRFQGIQGEKGDQGIPGTDGDTGATSYLHIAYAMSADGSEGFDVGDSDGKEYIGQYTDFTQADSDDPSDYSWTKIKGEDAVAVTITTSNGSVFKNSSGSTILTAHVYVAGAEQDIDDSGTCSIGNIVWYKGSSSVAVAKTLTVTADDVDVKAVYTASLEA